MFEAVLEEELMSRRVSDLYLDPTRRREVSENILREGSVKDAEMELYTSERPQVLGRDDCYDEDGRRQGLF